MPASHQVIQDQNHQYLFIMVSQRRYKALLRLNYHAKRLIRGKTVKNICNCHSVVLFYSVYLHLKWKISVNFLFGIFVRQLKILSL